MCSDLHGLAMWQFVVFKAHASPACNNHLPILSYLINHKFRLILVNPQLLLIGAEVYSCCKLWHNNLAMREASLLTSCQLMVQNRL